MQIEPATKVFPMLGCLCFCSSNEPGKVTKEAKALEGEIRDQDKRLDEIIKACGGKKYEGEDYVEEKTDLKKMMIAKKMDQMFSKIMVLVLLLILIFFFLFLSSFVYFQYFQWLLYSFTKNKEDLKIRLLKASNLNYLYIQWAI